MELQDFYTLKIGQEIYYQCKKVKILLLQEVSDKVKIIYFKFDLGISGRFEKIMHDLSFELPDEKKEVWFQHEFYFYRKNDHSWELKKIRSLQKWEEYILGHESQYRLCHVNKIVEGWE